MLNTKQMHIFQKRSQAWNYKMVNFASYLKKKNDGNNQHAVGFLKNALGRPISLLSMIQRQE